MRLSALPLPTPHTPAGLGGQPQNKSASVPALGLGRCASVTPGCQRFSSHFIKKRNTHTSHSGHVVRVGGRTNSKRWAWLQHLSALPRAVRKLAPSRGEEGSSCRVAGGVPLSLKALGGA